MPLTVGTRFSTLVSSLATAYPQLSSPAKCLSMRTTCGTRTSCALAALGLALVGGLGFAAWSRYRKRSAEDTANAKSNLPLPPGPSFREVPLSPFDLGARKYPVKPKHF